GVDAWPARNGSSGCEPEGHQHPPCNGFLTPASVALCCPVLGVGEVLAPHGFAFGEREMCHEVAGRGAVPVLFARGDADDVAGTDTNGRRTARLHESFAFGDEQRLAERVVMPRCVRARSEMHGPERPRRWSL